MTTPVEKQFTRFASLKLRRLSLRKPSEKQNAASERMHPNGLSNHVRLRLSNAQS